MRCATGAAAAPTPSTSPFALTSWPPGGLLVSTILTPPADAEAPAGGRGLSILVQPSRDDLARIGGLIDAGRMRPIVDTVLPLAEARRAHELSQAGHAHGRIVLRVA